MRWLEPKAPMRHLKSANQEQGILGRFWVSLLEASKHIRSVHWHAGSAQSVHARSAARSIRYAQNTLISCAINRERQRNQRRKNRACIRSRILSADGDASVGVLSVQCFVLIL